MVGKGVTTVAQLFLKLCLRIVGESELEKVSVFLVLLIFICLPLQLFLKIQVKLQF